MAEIDIMTQTAPTAQPSWAAVNATVAAGPAATAAATRRP